MRFAEPIGHTLDDKYKIERELGRGGMGTVYLATHLGTERPVAVKVIAPQFMERPEFVERFRREARAAGRLRHPNVVDVTDFGFAQTDEGPVAYLVMEYLDGCTLGEILDEEKNLPVDWTIDILDQVCSAVHEAHQQGIIHRDLKPDNIWLEPNQRGGYTVKVLDFGIAKLEAANAANTGEYPEGSQFSLASRGPATSAGSANVTAIHDSVSPTLISESATAVQFVPGQSLADVLGDKATAILDPVESAGDQDAVGTRLYGNSNPDSVSTTSDKNGFDSGTLATKALTRVGAVLGTPLYMSPEQCRGEKLDARSDVYSLGVIAYQMLAGRTPFAGDFTHVMDAHREQPPPPLKAKNIRRKLKGVIASALEKDPDMRPQTAEAFASNLRSRSEGIFGLLRRAGMIYTQHITKFLALSMFFHVPMIVLTMSLLTLNILKATETLNSTVANVLLGLTGTSLSLITAFCAYLITGTISWIVIHSLAVPLRPIRLRPSLREARKKAKRFAGAGILATLLSVAAAGVGGLVGFGIPFVILALIFGITGGVAVASGVVGALAGAFCFFFLSINLMLTSPVVMMENLTVTSAMRRSHTLVKRSFVTVFAAFVIMFMIPLVSAGTISLVINLAARTVERTLNERNGRTPEAAAASSENNASVTQEQAEPEINISFNTSQLDAVDKERNPVTAALFETLLQIVLLPLQIITTSFTAIIIALLYLKTRQAGGENLKDLMEKFEETDQPRKKWQERVRQRLIQSGRLSGSRS
jgi:serine/threonine protein kinase